MEDISLNSVEKSYSRPLVQFNYPLIVLKKSPYTDSP